MARLRGAIPGTFHRARPGLAAAVSAALLAGFTCTAAAAEGGVAEVEVATPDQAVEEVVVIGRYYDTAAQLVEERKEDSAVTNILGEDAIGRVGDSDVAAALRRVSGLTLVNDQFVYVRGLGERYSSTTLNGARVPSVDLTRNVIPLDLFPTYVVESLRVQKSYSVEQAASFGGGNIDIRTKGVPDGLVFGIEVGTGYNDQVSGDVLTYPGGSDDKWGSDDGTRALSNELLRGVSHYRGEIGVQNILTTMRAEGNSNATLADAETENRRLALLLDRNISIEEKDPDLDLDVKAYLGDSFTFGDNWEVGLLLAGAYEDEWRESTQLNRNYSFPEERTDEQQESTYSVNITGNGNFGLRWADDQEVLFSSLWLRNTDDETVYRTFFNENRERSSGLGFQDVRLKYEERKILVNQWRGTHRLGAATKELFDSFLPDDLVAIMPDDLELTWFYSDSEADTDIPNEVNVSRQGSADPLTGEISDPAVRTIAEAADYRFTSLDDEVEDYGWRLALPVYFDNAFLELSGGYRHTRQARTYEQTQFTLGLFGVNDLGLLREPLGDVFSDEVITDLDNGFELQRSGANNESYIAATMTEAYFGALDLTLWDTWRVSAGLRWEQYQQVGLDFNPYGYGVGTPVVTTDLETLLESVYSNDDYYPAVALTYISEDFFAETFQLRFGFAETVTRPDLREITGASYVDPLTNDLVFGNPGVIPSTLDNYDIRAEWFFSNGDNFTLSLFYKDITDPIEFFEAPASDTNIAREIVNADSAEIYGLEVELLKELGFIHPWLESLYAQLNLTFQDSELVAGPDANAPTNDRRDLTNAAPFTANLQLGYDSANGQHAATVVYNVFDERLFVAGRLGAPDGFEQGFNSLDVTYSYYPMEGLTVRAKVQNILDDSVEIERDGVTTFEEKIGVTFAASVSWEF